MFGLRPRENLFLIRWATRSTKHSTPLRKNNLFWPLLANNPQVGWVSAHSRVAALYCNGRRKEWGREDRSTEPFLNRNWTAFVSTYMYTEFVPRYSAGALVFSHSELKEGWPTKSLFCYFCGAFRCLHWSTKHNATACGWGHLCGSMPVLTDFTGLQA